MTDAELSKALEVEAERDQLRIENERLRAGYRAIQKAAVDGRVCDDVAWFDTITTLYDFCDQILGDEQYGDSNAGR